MKKILLSIFALVTFGVSQKAKAQCNVTDAAITITNQTPSGSNCQVTFDLSFKLEFNGGNKIVVIQAWLDQDYPNYWNCSSTHAQTGNHGAPKAADLKKNGTGPLPFLNLAFNNDVTPPTAITGANAYGPDGTVPLIGGYTITRGATDINGYQLITLTGVTVIAPVPCGTGATIRADLWSTQSNITSSWQPHCVNCNNIYSFGYPAVSAEIQCAIPTPGTRLFSTTVSNPNTDQPISYTFEAFYDDAPLGGSRGAEDTRSVFAEPLPLHALNPGQQETFTRQYSYASAADANRKLWVVVTTQGLANTTNAFADFTQGCIGLPVDFKSFTATRNRSNVLLKWETSMELDNTGFVVERNIGGTWQEIAFVPTQAQGGNSSDILTYTYTDLNTNKGISQYRLRQVDLNGKSKNSEIRSVRGEGQLGNTVVYPNPSADGKVNVVFDDASVTRNVSVIDMSGRVIKQWRNVTNNNLQIENLSTGVYSVRIIAVETGEQVVEKIVVNKR